MVVKGKYEELCSIKNGKGRVVKDKVEDTYLVTLELNRTEWKTLGPMIFRLMAFFLHVT